MKKILAIIGIILTQFLLVAYAGADGSEANGNLVFLSEEKDEEYANVYMLLANKEGELVPLINARSKNEEKETIKPYEAVLLSPSRNGFIKEKNDSSRNAIGVYRLADNQILYILNDAVGAAGPNHPHVDNYFKVYEYSLDAGFQKTFEARLTEKYDKFDNPGYSMTERECYIGDDMVIPQEFFSQLSSLGIQVKTEEFMACEASDTPQKYEIYLADMEESCLLSLVDRNVQLPESIHHYLGIEEAEKSSQKVESSSDKKVLEGTLTDEEIKEAKKIEKEKAKERKKEERQKKKEEREQAKADGTTIPLGELILRAIIAMVVVLFTVFCCIFVFSLGWFTVIADMFVIFICMTLIGGDRMMRWLNMDIQSLLMLFVMFFGGILGCALFEWDKLGGVTFVVQMLFLTLAISGIISSDVLNSWITNVALLAAIPLAIIVIIMVVICILVPLGIGEIILAVFKLL